MNKLHGIVLLLALICFCVLSIALIKLDKGEVIIMGPFSGRVIDAVTEKPLTHVPVVVIFNCTQNSEFPEACWPYQALYTETDIDGNFFIGIHLLFSHRPTSVFLHINRNTAQSMTCDSHANVANTAIMPCREITTPIGQIKFGVEPNGYHVIISHDEVPIQGFVFSKAFNIMLLPSFASVAECSKVEDRNVRIACVRLFAYTAAESIWPHGGTVNENQMSYFYENDIFNQFMRSLNKTCEKVSMEPICISRSAIASRSPEQCEVIQDPLKRASCLMTTAVELGDSDTCMKLPSIEHSVYDPEMMTTLYNGKCLFYTAVRQRLPLLCNMLEQLPSVSDRFNSAQALDKKDCWQSLAKLLSQPKLCENILRTSDSLYCISQMNND